MKLAGKVALVTGAARGMGESLHCASPKEEQRWLFTMAVAAAAAAKL